MEATTRIFLVLFLATFGFFALIVVPAFMIALYPAVALWGLVLLVVAALALVGLVGYSFGWWASINILELDGISGGGKILGIFREPPYETSIRNVVSEALDDATVTVIPVSPIFGRPVLLPVSKDIALSWADVSNRVWKIVRVYGTQVSLDEFLARLYGLDVDLERPERSNPNDLNYLKSLLSRLNSDPLAARRARRFVYVVPFAHREFLAEALRESPTVAEASLQLRSMQRLHSFYTRIIRDLQSRLQRLASMYSRDVQKLSASVLETVDAHLKSQTEPYRIVGQLAGVPAEKAFQTGAALAFEYPPALGQIAKETIERIQEVASPLGLALVPREVEEQHRKSEEIVSRMVSGIEVVPAKKEEGEGERGEGEG